MCSSDLAETIAASSGIGHMAMEAREFMQVDVVVQPAATLRGRVVRQRDGAPVATFEGWRCRVPGGTWRWQAQGGPAHVTVGIGPVDAGIPG